MEAGYVADQTPNAPHATLMAGALAHEFFTPPDPAFAITRFDFDRDPARMEAFSAIFDTYRDATLAAFRKRGGKLLIFHGTADPIFSALESIDYYQRLTRNNGGAESTARWARLFLVPGMNHCAGGPATDSFDGLAAIVNWVEQGAAPSRIEASARPGASSFAGRTRPLCAFPPTPVTPVPGVSRTARTSPARRGECASAARCNARVAVGAAGRSTRCFCGIARARALQLDSQYRRRRSATSPSTVRCSASSSRDHPSPEAPPM